MEQFLEKLYNYEYFGTYLMISIAVLVLLFIVILFFGKRDQKNREIEATKKLQQINNDTFKDDSIVEKVEVPNNNGNNNMGVNPINNGNTQNLNDTMVMPSIESINEFANRELNQFNQNQPVNSNNEINLNNGMQNMPLQNNSPLENANVNLNNNLQNSLETPNLNNNINNINSINTPTVKPEPIEQFKAPEPFVNPVTPDLNTVFPSNNEQSNNLFNNTINNVNTSSNEFVNSTPDSSINLFNNTNENINKPLLDKNVDKPFQFSEIDINPFNGGNSHNNNFNEGIPKNVEPSEMAVPEFNFDDIMKTIEKPQESEAVKQPELPKEPIRKFSEADFADQATAPYSNNYVKSPNVFSSVYAPPKEEKLAPSEPSFDFDFDRETKNVPSSEEIDIELPSLKRQEDNTSVNIELPNLNNYDDTYR